MYQQFPGGSNSVDTPPPSAPPQSVQRAVKVMYVGLAASLIGIIIGLTTISSVRSAIVKADPTFTTAQINSAEHVLVGLSIASGLIGAALWLWMAQKCRAGRGWARILSTVFFGIDTLSMFAGFAGATSRGLSSFYAIITWLIGLTTIILLWRRESSEFFNANARRY
jgi:hypothetical protein